MRGVVGVAYESLVSARVLWTTPTETLTPAAIVRMDSPRSRRARMAARLSSSTTGRFQAILRLADDVDVEFQVAGEPWHSEIRGADKSGDRVRLGEERDDQLLAALPSVLHARELASDVGPWHVQTAKMLSYEGRIERPGTAIVSTGLCDALFVYLRLKARPHWPQRISPGLYPPIRNLVRQWGQVTVYPPGLPFIFHLRWARWPVSDRTRRFSSMHTTRVQCWARPCGHSNAGELWSWGSPPESADDAVWPLTFGSALCRPGRCAYTVVTRLVACVYLIWLFFCRISVDCPHGHHSDGPQSRHRAGLWSTAGEPARPSQAHSLRASPGAPSAQIPWQTFAVPFDRAVTRDRLDTAQRRR